MQISLTKFSLFLAGIISIGLVIGSLYFLFTIFFGGPKPDDFPIITVSNIGVFGPRIHKAAAVLVDPDNKVELNKDKNLKFLTSDLYLSFTENPDVIPLSQSRGRPDPFVPYVAP